MKRILLTSGLLAALFVGLLAIPTTQKADAALGIQICNLKCFNGWDGGSDVKTFDTGAFNNNFVLDFVKGRCAPGSYVTTSNCPIPGTPAGLSIVQIKETYANMGSFECIGDYQGLVGRADAEAFDVCNNDQTGAGGDYGTIFIIGSPNCGGGNVGTLINSHWSSSYSNSGARAINSNMNSNGNQFYLNVATPFPCWTESNF